MCFAVTKNHFCYNQPKKSCNRLDFLFAGIGGSAFFCWNRDNFLLEQFLVFATVREIPFSYSLSFLC
mgnify:CR=1 FL=1